MRILPFILLATILFVSARADEELPILVRSFVAAEEGVEIQEFEEGKFVPRKGETIAFLGGTDTFNQQRYPELEILMQRAWPELQLKFRNLGWQGDTVFHQARPRFFYTKVGDPLPGSSPDTRERTEVGIIVMNFGRSESLNVLNAEDPHDAMSEFIDAYRILIDQLIERTGTRRIVLLQPTPFFATGPAASLADDRNLMLALYCGKIRELAESRGLLAVNGFGAFLGDGFAKYSDNGIHLNSAGHFQLAQVFAGELDFPTAAKASGESDNLVRQAIQRRNRLWQQYYHPTNWAFLFGDRQHVPASRDHIDTNKRWFVEELDTLPKLIAEAEEDIYRYAGGTGEGGK